MNVALHDPDFLADLRFSINTPNLILSFFVLYLAIGIVQMWRDDEPKSERFYFACGICFHWLATLFGRSIDLLKESHSILVRTSHLLTSINLILVFIAGVFYVRALTSHYAPDLWKWTIGVYTTVAISLLVCKYLLL